MTFAMLGLSLMAPAATDGDGAGFTRLGTIVLIVAVIGVLGIAGWRSPDQPPKRKDGTDHLDPDD